MSLSTSRSRWAWAAALLSAAALAAAVTLVRSHSEGCSLPPPLPDLPDRLRALGDFDRPYEVADDRDLRDVAARAAAALHPDLIGSLPQRPVAVAAGSDGLHDALVVPLLAGSVAGLAGQPPHLAGAVAFLRDCTGRAYYSAVGDVSTAVPPLPAFPTLSRERARALLQTDEVTLIHRGDPLQPLWRDPRSHRELAAR